MNLIKEHHHKLLVALFLFGIVLVFGSIQSRTPDMAIAASTPGTQSAPQSINWAFRYGQPDFYSTSAVTNVTYSGEVKKQSTGSLIQTSTVLNPGDVVTLDIFTDAAYFVTGVWTDSPPAPWVGDDFLTKLLPSNWVYRGEFSGSGIPLVTAPRLYAFEFQNLPVEEWIGWLPSSASLISAGYCSATHLSNVLYSPMFCLQTSVKIPTISLNPSGMTCGSLSASDVSEGLRQYSTTCTINTSGPQASITANVTGTVFYYPAITRERSDGYYFPDAGRMVNVPGYTPLNIVESCNSDGDCGVVSSGDPGTTDINQFYGIASVAPAVLSWNIDVAPVVIPAPILTFSGNPTSITSGNSSNLTWILSGGPTTNCSSTGGWSGSKDKNGGTQSVSPSVDTTYNLECTGPGGSSGIQQVTISVSPSTTQCSDLADNDGDGKIDFGGGASNDPGCTSPADDNEVNTGANQHPVPDAQISKDGITYSNSIVVMRGEIVSIKLRANGSNDTDGTISKCLWNADLQQGGSPDYETTKNVSTSIADCNTDMIPPSTQFWDSPGTYNYRVLHVTDNNDLSSVIPAQVSVVVVDSGFGATCSVDPENINTGGSATWTASAVGGTGSYTYSWSGSSSLSGTLNPMPKTYTTPGNKTAQVVVNSGTESATAACSNSVFVSNAPTQCSDLVDNADPEDFLADMADPGCTSPSDNDETNVVVVTQCSDGVDNTDPEDFLIDMADPGCTSPSDNDETNISGPFCGDGVINQASEECDGADLSGKTCLALGYSRGTLSCTSCKFNLNKCVKIREN